MTQEQKELLEKIHEKYPYGEWKVIPDYPNYVACSTGQIANLKTGKLRKFSNHKGYCQCMIRKDGKRYNKFVHRLVANAFLPKPNGDQIIDHINGIRSDNRPENLRWCTVDENLHFPLAVKNRDHLRKPCSQYDLHGKYIKSFNSIFEASENLKLSSGSIYNCCINKKITCGNFQWKFGRNTNNIDPVRENKRNIKVAQYDKDNNLIKIYPSCHNAAKITGLTQQVINECVNGKRKTPYGGFWWRKA